MTIFLTILATVCAQSLGTILYVVATTPRRCAEQDDASGARIVRAMCRLSALTLISGSLFASLLAFELGGWTVGLVTLTVTTVASLLVARELCSDIRTRD